MHACQIHGRRRPDSGAANQNPDIHTQYYSIRSAPRPSIVPFAASGSKAKIIKSNKQEIKSNLRIQMVVRCEMIVGRRVRK
jgi:hypothetical protein